MKTINILSLAQAYTSIKGEGFASYLNHYDINIRNQELEDLSQLVGALYMYGGIYIFNNFYVGYKIPQIGKEFDLLKIGENYIVNIELKSTSSEDKIKNQLIRNKYYLSSLGKPVYNFTFVSKEKNLYLLNFQTEEIQRIDFTYLKQVLDNQLPDHIDNVDKLFNPSAYLVSPFNSTDRFVAGEYFLTHQQEEIKNKVLEINKNSPISRFISITGSAGTGKTLLVYDIAKEIFNTQMKVLIIHCGLLNDGHHKLKSQYHWEIDSIKYYSCYNLPSYNMIIIDEAQRIQTDQLDKIVKSLQATRSTCIFSYDKRQTLASWEEKRNIDQHINNINSIDTFKLTDKIRTNKEIASFIKALFDKRHNPFYDNSENIELNYFSRSYDAKVFLDSLGDQNWEVIRFTPSRYNKEYHTEYSSLDDRTSHSVIGQEFDNVVVVVDQFFSYSNNGELIYNGEAYYHPAKMLFQNITRTVRRLNIVILNNNELLDRCISIMKV